jgi:hypothetical protein
MASADFEGDSRWWRWWWCDNAYDVRQGGGPWSLFVVVEAQEADFLAVNYKLDRGTCLLNCAKMSLDRAVQRQLRGQRRKCGMRNVGGRCERGVAATSTVA